MPTSSQLTYTGSTGEAVELDGPLAYVGTGLGIRGREWAYSLGRRGISGQYRAAREATLTADFLDLAECDRARDVFDRDVASGTPGTLSSGGWSQRAYVVKSEPSDRYHGWVRADITVLLLDGAWSAPHTASFEPSTLASDYGKAYEYGYPYDYGPPAPARSVEVPGTVPGPFRLVIWGRAVQPSITIGGNSYSFDISVPAGGYLLVDTLHEPMVELVTADGIRTDAFDAARRGGGLGSGSYAFEPIAPGSQLVSWDDSFGFDLTAYELEGEIPWRQRASSYSTPLERR